MALYLLIGIVLAVCLWLMLRAALAADPRKLATVIRWALALGLAGVAGFLLFRGHPGGMLASLGAAMLFLVRWGWLLRRLAPLFRRRPRVALPPEPAAMTRTQALDILGLVEGATKAEILEAHRLRTFANHPERGGSPWRTAEIDQARDVLLQNP